MSLETLNVGAEYRISKGPGYVIVERTPGYVVTLNKQPKMLADMFAACEELDCRRILLRGSQTDVRLSVVDIFELGKEIAKLGLHIAITENHDASVESVEFLETISLNRGGSLEFFNNDKDAIEWLETV